jgi:hypothetical protein
MLSTFRANDMVMAQGIINDQLYLHNEWLLGQIAGEEGEKTVTE